MLRRRWGSAPAALRHVLRAAAVVLAVVGTLVVVEEPPASAQSAQAWQSAVGVTCKINAHESSRAGRCNYVGTDVEYIMLSDSGLRYATVWDAGGIYFTATSSVNLNVSNKTLFGLDPDSTSCSPTMQLNRVNSTWCYVGQPHTWPYTLGFVGSSGVASIPDAFTTVVGGGGGGSTTTTSSTSTTTTTRPPGQADGGGSTCASDTQLSYEQALAFIEAAGLDDADEQVIMLAIMTAESGRQVGIVSPPNAGPPPVGGSVDLGLMQLNSWFQVESPAGHQFDRARLLDDPLYNIQSALIIRTEWGNWNAWTTYTSGAFLAFVDAATDAVLEGAEDPPEGCDGTGTVGPECDGGFLDIGGKLKCAIMSALRFLFIPTQSNVSNVVSSARAYDAKVPFSIVSDVAQAGAAVGTNTPAAVAAHRDECFPILSDLPTIGAASPDGVVEVCAADTETQTSGLRTALGIGIYVLFGLQVARMAQRAIKS